MVQNIACQLELEVLLSEAAVVGVPAEPQPVPHWSAQPGTCCQAAGGVVALASAGVATGVAAGTVGGWVGVVPSHT